MVPNDFRYKLILKYSLIRDFRSYEVKFQSPNHNYLVISVGYKGLFFVLTMHQNNQKRAV